jgi:tRNA pseudouridine13 synthase
MRLKRIPEDFQVEEQVALAATGGPFALYRLTKQSLGTPEAIDAILRRWALPRQQLAFAGLKDKHAQTTQYLTIRSGQRRGLAQTNLSLEYVGQIDRPVHASDITGNRFTVVLRDLSQDEHYRLTANVAAVAKDGVPNYFDNQRFGSLGESGEFIAKPWCLGDYERALWLAIADPNVHDRPDEREEKRILREQWGNWRLLAAQSVRWRAASDARNIVAFLANQPRDFRRAIALAPQHLRSLWLAAYQSHLWNQILAALVRQICRPWQIVSQSIGSRDVPFFTDLDDAQRDQLARSVLPLASARLHPDPSPLKDLYDRVLAAEGIELREIRVKYPRDSFFSKGERPATLQPLDLQHAAADDDLYPGRQKLTLRFTLPRGAYATILVKRVVGFAGGDITDDDDSESLADAAG